MQLQPVSDFFNWANNPWTPVAVPRYGEWLPPGLSYNSCLQHVDQIRKTNPMESPAQMVFYSCLSVDGGSMDVLLYAGNMDLPWVDYPWKDGNMVELAVLHVPDTQGHLVNRGVYVTGQATDDFMELARVADQIRIGVACRSKDGGKMLWHSAQLCVCYY